MRAPRVDAKATFLAHAFDVVFVEDFERQAEPVFKFIFPLEQHGRRSGDNDVANTFAQE